ncbi:MAG: hypothetical protein OXH11_18735, partial [Candidatus Aminicenantes bacterium]|nr:hypothetical protein [Candidatus Aminicenantes bacterium]
NSLSQRIQDGQKTTEKAYEHFGKRIDRLEENIRSDVKSMNDRIDRHKEIVELKNSAPDDFI